jgi:flagellar protein FliS
MSASPHQLITMLFDGAKTAIAMARHHMANKDISAKGQAISKAINIVDNGLKASLDADAAGVAGAQLVADLSAFYAYVTQRLLYANLRNDPALLDEADRLLDSVSSAWREIDPQRRSRCRSPRTRRRRVFPRELDLMGSQSEVMHCYEQIAPLTERMLVLARAKQWGELPQLEGQCSSMVERLKDIEPLSIAGRGAIGAKVRAVDAHQRQFQ